MELWHEGALAGLRMLVACYDMVQRPLATRAEEATSGLDGVRGWLGAAGARGMEERRKGQ